MHKLKIVLIMGLMIIFCGIYVYAKEWIKKDELFVTGMEVVDEKEVIILNSKRMDKKR
jgi:predicted transporter